MCVWVKMRENRANFSCLFNSNTFYQIQYKLGPNLPKILGNRSQRQDHKFEHSFLLIVITKENKSNWAHNFKKYSNHICQI